MPRSAGFSLRATTRYRMVMILGRNLVAPFRSIVAAIGKATGERWEATDVRTVAGGSINTAVVLEGPRQRYFVKLNAVSGTEMFAAEAEGLRELARAGAVRVPAPICWGNIGDRSYIVLEFIEFGAGDDTSQERLGEALGRLHRSTQPVFGWNRDNTIGSTPQRNSPSTDWIDFWRRQRLEYQLELAIKHGYAARLERPGRRLTEHLSALFIGYQPAASLLHGDLWSGNHGATALGEPVIFDPAVYYGDREADIAMTELFGGFSTRFYDAYRAQWPLDPGYATRKTLYNLYHVLNHLHLFGGGYLAEAERMIHRLLSEVR